MGKLIFLLVIVTNLISCAQWPRPSTGGYAAHYIFTASYQKELRKAPELSLLSQRLAIALAKTNAIRNGHGFRCFPARRYLMFLLAERIAQEIASNLTISANADLMLYENNLVEIIKLNKTKRCPRPAKSACWELLKMRLAR